MRTDPPSRLLVADDQADVIEALRLLLKPEGFSIDGHMDDAERKFTDVAGDWFVLAHPQQGAIMFVTRLS